MNPSPQDSIAIESSSGPVSGEHVLPFGLDFIRSQMKHHSPPPPFSYGYVLEDGKMPQLAEFHAVERKGTAEVLRSSSTRSALRPERRPVPINRSSSYNSAAKPTTTIDISLPHESTTDRIKRAFSLSSGRNSTQPSRQPSIASRRESTHRSNTQPTRHASQSGRRPKTNLTIHGLGTMHSTPPSASRVPSLILPTPTPSPEPVHSASSSPQKPPMNFTLPNHNVKPTQRPFSWAYDDDVEGDEDVDDDADDIAFSQVSGMGRITANHRSPTQFRKEKAFELLGITSKSKISSHNPALSAATSYRASPATSDRDHLSRSSSRKISQEEHSRGELNQSGAAGKVDSQSRRVSTPTRSPIASAAEEETPGPNRQLRYQGPFYSASSPLTHIVVKKPISNSRPGPIMVPKIHSPPSDQIRSAPPVLLSKAGLPIIAANDQSLVLAEPQPLPASVIKVSRFIEHLDTNANRLSLPITHTPVIVSRAAFLERRTLIDPDVIAPAPRRATSPLPAALRDASSAVVPRVEVTPGARASVDLGSSHTSFKRLPDASGLRRSGSMREASTGPWGAVLCTAEARPIVATGQAKMV